MYFSVKNKVGQKNFNGFSQKKNSMFFISGEISVLFRSECHMPLTYSVSVF